MEMLEELAAVLRERIAIIADEESRQNLPSHLDRLKNVSETIAKIERQLPATIDPQLRHFLERCSYSKALELLENRRATNTSPSGVSPRD
jgi:hypothetical protein